MSVPANKPELRPLNPSIGQILAIIAAVILFTPVLLLGVYVIVKPMLETTGGVEHFRHWVHSAKLLVVLVITVVPGAIAFIGVSWPMLRRWMAKRGEHAANT